MARTPASIESLLPLTPRVLLILWGLHDGPQHPYRLLRIAEDLGRGRVSIGPASLYEAIHALRDKGLIAESTAPDDEPDPDSRRRYFKLTRLGRDVLQAEADRIAELSNDLRRARIMPRRP